MTPFALLALAAALQHAHAHEDGEVRAHEAHVHGAAQIAAAADPDGRLVIDLQTPGDNVVGFERAPRDDAESAALAAALERLAGGAALFAFPDAAGCVFQTAEIAVPENYGLSGGTESHGDGAHGMDHGGDRHGPHNAPPETDHQDAHQSHPQSAHHPHPQSDPHEHHAHETHYAASGHANLSAEYAFLCARPDRLTSIGVGFFEAFDGFEEIDIVFLDRTRQRSARLRPGQAVFDLR